MRQSICSAAVIAAFLLAAISGFGVLGSGPVWP
jgi:hypothetical protein